MLLSLFELSLIYTIFIGEFAISMVKVVEKFSLIGHFSITKNSFVFLIIIESSFEIVSTIMASFTTFSMLLAILECSPIVNVFIIVHASAIGSPKFHLSLVIFAIAIDKPSISMRSSLKKGAFIIVPIGVKIATQTMRHIFLNIAIGTAHYPQYTTPVVLNLKYPCLRTPRSYWIKTFKSAASNIKYPTVSEFARLLASKMAPKLVRIQIFLFRLKKGENLDSSNYGDLWVCVRWGQPFSNSRSKYFYWNQHLSVYVFFPLAASQCLLTHNYVIY